MKRRKKDCVQLNSMKLVAQEAVKRVMSCLLGEVKICSMDMLVSPHSEASHWGTRDLICRRVSTTVVLEDVPGRKRKIEIQVEMRAVSDTWTWLPGEIFAYESAETACENQGRTNQGSAWFSVSYYLDVLLEWNPDWEVGDPHTQAGTWKLT
jgi:hypothetical protein